MIRSPWLAVPLAVLIFGGTLAITLNTSSSFASLLIVATALAEFGGLLTLALRRGGWRGVGRGFLTLSFACLVAYLTYIFILKATHNHLPEPAERALYAAVIASAVMAFLTFPWREETAT